MRIWIESHSPKSQEIWDHYRPALSAAESGPFPCTLSLSGFLFTLTLALALNTLRIPDSFGRCSAALMLCYHSLPHLLKSLPMSCEDMPTGFSVGISWLNWTLQKRQSGLMVLIGPKLHVVTKMTVFKAINHVIAYPYQSIYPYSPGGNWQTFYHS